MKLVTTQSWKPDYHAPVMKTTLHFPHNNRTFQSWNTQPILHCLYLLSKRNINFWRNHTIQSTQVRTVHQSFGIPQNVQSKMAYSIHSTTNWNEHHASLYVKPTHCLGEMVEYDTVPGVQKLSAATWNSDVLDSHFIFRINLSINYNILTNHAKQKRLHDLKNIHQNTRRYRKIKYPIPIIGSLPHHYTSMQSAPLE